MGYIEPENLSVFVCLLIPYHHGNSGTELSAAVSKTSSFLQTGMG